MRIVLLPPGPAPGQSAPFRFWFFVKITLVVALTQSSFYAASVAVLGEGVFAALLLSGAGLGLHLPTVGAPANLTTPLIVIGIFVGAIALSVWILLGWLWCRLRFTLFDLVLYLHGRVAVAWSRYPVPAWRFLGLTILVSLGFLLLLALTAGPLIFHLVLTIRRLTPGEISSDPTIFLAYVLPLYAVVPLMALFFATADAIVEDFLLPPMAIEAAPVDQAFSQCLHMLRSRPGSVVLYLLLRFGLQTAMGFAGTIALFLVIFILGAGGAGLGVVLFHSLHQAGSAGFVLFVVYCGVAGLTIVAVYFLAMVAIQGVVAVFRQCFAISFYGGHYLQLGNLLNFAPLDRATPGSAPDSPLEPPPPLA